MFFTSFEHFDGEKAGRGIDKRFLSKDWFLFDLVENISTIDLIIDADFFNSLLRCLSCFSVVNKLHPLTLYKYPPILFF